ncbi:hypothetical protein LJC42_01765 [Eubacteriales bacterium OttesenSCG-928-K08]|nr:hypothetical protein [Eubacteriales bacterium OttesenSCG-928-K08]
MDSNGMISVNAFRILGEFGKVKKFTTDERNSLFASDEDKEAITYLENAKLIEGTDFASYSGVGVVGRYATAYKITEKGRAVLDDHIDQKHASRKADKRWRITTTIAVVALIVAILALIPQILPLLNSAWIE